MRIFEALFKVLSTQFGPRTVEKSVENPDFIFCSSFQNLRLGSINFKIFVWEHIMMFPTLPQPQHKMDPNRPSRASNNSMLPKRRFWKDEKKMKCGFSMEFSTIRSPNRVLTPLKSASNIRISSFVHPSKIFVWEG
jgi:hypothetical protein